VAEIAIVLDPSRLANPVADLRYALAGAIERACGQLVRDDAYDYDDAGRMWVFLVTHDLAPAVVAVTEALSRLEVLGNRFDGEGVELWVAEADHQSDLSRYTRVHPRVSSPPT